MLRFHNQPLVIWNLAGFGEINKTTTRIPEKLELFKVFFFFGTDNVTIDNMANNYFNLCAKLAHFSCDAYRK